MSNLITEIYDKQAVVDNLNQLGELINSSLNAIVASAPKLQSPIEYLTAVQSISEIEKKNTEVTQAKVKALSDLDKAYQQADKAMNQSIALEDEEYKEVTKLTNEYKERAKEQRQLLELERTRQQTMQNGNKLLQMEAKSEAELRMQQQQLIKAQQSLRVTNAEENALREKLIAKINANKEALRGMSDEVSKQRDNIGNYKSALEGVVTGQIDLREAMALTRKELQQLETLQATGAALTAEQRQRYNDLNLAMGQMKDIQGDISARTKILADDYRKMTFTMEGIKLGVNIMTSLQSVTALLGGENEELQKAMAKVVATQQVLNTITQIQNQLNKDGIIQTNLRLIQEGYIERQTKINTTATIAYGNAQNFAQKASVALKLGVQSVGNAMKSIPIVGWIGAAISAIMVLYSKLQAVRDEQKKAYDESRQKIEEINKKIADSAAESATKFLQLSHSYQKLGDDMKAKEQFIKDNQKAFDDLGVSVTNVKDAEDLLINNKKKFIEAEIAKATAMAAREQAQALISEILLLKQAQEESNKLGEAQMAIYKAQGMTEYELEKITRTYQDANKEYETEIKLRQTQVEQLFDVASTLPHVTGEVKNLTQANKELKISLEELQEQEELWAKTQLNDIFKNTTKNLTEQMDATAELIDKKKELVATIEIEEEEEAEHVKTLTELLKEQAEATKKLWEERKNATFDALNYMNDAAKTIGQQQSERLDKEMEEFDDYYARRKNIIENTVLDEEVKNRRLQALENEKVAKERQIAKQRAEIERKQAIFQNAVDAAAAMSKAVASVGELLATSAGGDPYSAIARYIAAIAAGVSAVATISTLISKLLNIPAFEKGGTAQANQPFIAGEKGREIGFGVYSGKVYDFSKPTLFKANEPINIKNATETRQIINNNEYNKDVTLHNEVVVQVIDNKRIEKFFKI